MNSLGGFPYKKGGVLVVPFGGLESSFSTSQGVQPQKFHKGSFLQGDEMG